jgi:hypothetical protein
LPIGGEAEMVTTLRAAVDLVGGTKRNETEESKSLPSMFERENMNLGYVAHITHHRRKKPLS